MAFYASIIHSSGSSGTASESSYYSITTKATKAIDQNTGTYWRPSTPYTPNWVMYAPSTAKVCTKYSLTEWLGGAMAKDFTLKASTTGAFAGEEVTLDTRTGETGWTVSETRSYTFTNTTAYSYYKITITDTTSYGLYLAEFDLFEELEPEAYLTGSATIIAKATPIPKADVTGSAILSAEAVRRTHGYGFTVLQELELSQYTQTFNFVQRMETTASTTVIRRINS